MTIRKLRSYTAQLLPKLGKSGKLFFDRKRKDKYSAIYVDPRSPETIHLMLILRANTRTPEVNCFSYAIISNSPLDK